MPIRNKKVGRKGLAFVIVLAFILILVIAAATFIALSGTEIRMARRQHDSSTAFYIAEGGFERARYDLQEDDDWMDGDINGVNIPIGGDIANFYLLDYDQIDPAIRASLGGEFTVWLMNVEGKDDEIWIRSRGVFQNETRAVRALMKSTRRFGSPDGVTSAIESEGEVEVKGSAEVNGNIEEWADLSFEDIFGVDKAEMEQIAQTYYPATYYTAPFNNDSAQGVTWIRPNETDPQITLDGWSGSGILIVEDDLKITGGTFDGVIWVVGTLRMDGNPVINGGIFVECGARLETTLTGNPTVNFDSEAVEDAFYRLTSLPSMIESWQEVD